MKREIGGYIELEHYNRPRLHENALGLNSGRNCLAYLCRAKKIKKLVLPFFLCDSVFEICERERIQMRFYHIDETFMPMDVDLAEDEWFYLVNFYGQLDNATIEGFAGKYKRVIVDHTQAYFQKPLAGIDTIYSCRKFLGVPDGAFLYTDTAISEELPLDVSYERMHCLLGRLELGASEFYAEHTAHEAVMSEEPIRKMSLLTETLLRSLDYEEIQKRRTANFQYLHEHLKKRNKLSVKMPEGGSIYYPFMVDGADELRKKLVSEKIYVTKLWPEVLPLVTEDSIESRLVNNILPLPMDQRYEESDMERICNELEKM